MLHNVPRTCERGGILEGCFRVEATLLDSERTAARARAEICRTFVFLSNPAAISAVAGAKTSIYLLDILSLRRGDISPRHAPIKSPTCRAKGRAPYFRNNDRLVRSIRRGRATNADFSQRECHREREFPFTRQRPRLYSRTIDQEDVWMLERKSAKREDLEIDITRGRKRRVCSEGGRRGRGGGKRTSMCCCTSLPSFLAIDSALLALAPTRTRRHL